MTIINQDEMSIPPPAPVITFKRATYRLLQDSKICFKPSRGKSKEKHSLLIIKQNKGKNNARLILGRKKEITRVMSQLLTMEMTKKDLVKLSENSKIGYLWLVTQGRGKLRKYLELGYIAESEEGKRARTSLC